MQIGHHQCVHENMPPKKSRKASGNNTGDKVATKKKKVEVKCITERTELKRMWQNDDGTCFKVVSWNVNGIRAVLKKSPNAFVDLVKKADYPDVICLQETKLQEKHLDDVKLNLKSLLKEEGYSSFWTCSTAKAGYSGSVAFVKTSIKVPSDSGNGGSVKKKKGLTKFFDVKKRGSSKKESKEEEELIDEQEFVLEPICDSNRILAAPVEYDIGGSKNHGKEGRIVSLHFPQFTLIALYVPNSGRKLERLDYRIKEWDTDLLTYVKKIESDRNVSVIWLGDLNVAHKGLDVYNDGAKHLTKSAGTTTEEKESFSTQLSAGYVDIFRHFHPDAEAQYTWWSTIGRGRPENKVSRIHSLF